MPRVNLSIDDQLFEKLDSAAKQRNITVNLLIISTLEGIYYDHAPFNYHKALNKLIEEAKTFPDGKEFILLNLPSFSEICVVKAEKANIKPAMIRARLGKAFNEAVRDGSVPWVKRAKTLDKAGNTILKFNSRAAVYIIDRSFTGNTSSNGDKYIEED